MHGPVFPLPWIHSKATRRKGQQDLQRYIDIDEEQHDTFFAVGFQPSFPSLPSKAFSAEP